MLNSSVVIIVLTFLVPLAIHASAPSSEEEIALSIDRLSRLQKPMDGSDCPWPPLPVTRRIDEDANVEGPLLSEVVISPTETGPTGAIPYRGELSPKYLEVTSLVLEGSTTTEREVRDQVACAVTIFGQCNIKISKVRYIAAKSKITPPNFWFGRNGKNRVEGWEDATAFAGQIGFDHRPIAIFADKITATGDPNDQILNGLSLTPRFETKSARGTPLASGVSFLGAPGVRRTSSRKECLMAHELGHSLMDTKGHQFKSGELISESEFMGEYGESTAVSPRLCRELRESPLLSDAP